jgi:outer membrane beta-barrel protein
MLVWFQNSGNVGIEFSGLKSSSFNINSQIIEILFNIKFMYKYLIVFMAYFPLQVAAQLIEFPDNELAQESVLPVFDKVEVVKSRNVQNEKRFEFGAGFGLNLTEALYDNKNLNFNLTYNFTNLHAINIIGLMPIEGLSNTGSDLAAGKGLSGGRFDASLAPYPQNYLSANYQITAYYGKISLSKDYVMNLSLYGLAGLSMIQFTDSSTVGAQFGMGQKFFFTKHLALRFDLLGYVYSGPDPTSAVSLNPNTVTEPVPSSSLDETLNFRTFFNLGLTYIL